MSFFTFIVTILVRKSCDIPVCFCLNLDFSTLLHSVIYRQNSGLKGIWKMIPIHIYRSSQSGLLCERYA